MPIGDILESLKTGMLDNLHIADATIEYDEVRGNNLDLVKGKLPELYEAGITDKSTMLRVVGGLARETGDVRLQEFHSNTVLPYGKGKQVINEFFEGR